MTYTLPFVFNFYGTTYSTVHISTNGNVHFGAPNDYWPGKSNLCVPANSPYVPKALVAPLWYDFVVSSTLQGGVYTDIVGTSPNRTYIVDGATSPPMALPTCGPPSSCCSKRTATLSTSTRASTAAVSQARKQ